MGKVHKKAIKVMNNLKNENILKELLDITENFREITIQFDKQIIIEVLGVLSTKKIIYNVDEQEEKYLNDIDYTDAKKVHKKLEELKEQLKRY